MVSDWPRPLECQRQVILSVHSLDEYVFSASSVPGLVLSLGTNIPRRPPQANAGRDQLTSAYC